MTRVNIYLPDELAAQARAAGLNVSALAREAVRQSLDGRSTNAWLATLRPAPRHRVTHDHVIDALDAVREERSTGRG